MSKFVRLLNIEEKELFVNLSKILHIEVHHEVIFAYDRKGMLLRLVNTESNRINLGINEEYVANNPARVPYKK